MLTLIIVGILATASVAYVIFFNKSKKDIPFEISGLVPWLLTPYSVISTILVIVIPYLAITMISKFLFGYLFGMVIDETLIEKVGIFVSVFLFISSLVSHGKDETDKKNGIGYIRIVSPKNTGIPLVFGKPIEGVTLKPANYFIWKPIIDIGIVPNKIAPIVAKDLTKTVSKDMIEIRAEALVRIRVTNPTRVYKWGIDTITSAIKEYVAVILRDIAKLKGVVEWVKDPRVNGNSLAGEMTKQMVERKYAHKIPGEINWIDLEHLGVLIEIEMSEFEPEDEKHRKIFAGPALKKQEMATFTVEQNKMRAQTKKHLVMLKEEGHTGSRALTTANLLTGASKEEKVQTVDVNVDANPEVSKALGNLGTALSVLLPFLPDKKTPEKKSDEE